MEDSFYELIKFVEGKTSFRLASYKERPLARRLKVRMRIIGIESYRDYQRYLVSNPKEIELLQNTLTINLSYFFRNPETFECLKENVLNQYAANAETHVWSAGCAQGEEAYSVAILFSELGFLERVRIYGTDIDRGVLNRAKQGLFPATAFQYTPRRIIEKYFRPEGQGYAIDESIKNAVRFVRHDLFEPPDFPKCDLILCRNVLIYFDRKGQSVVLKNFHAHLKDEGLLVIGKVELLLGIPEARLFTVVNRTEHIYRKCKAS